MHDNDIFNDILKKLKETERNNSVKIPLAIESGSRSWGFASPDSDYDCRFVYVHEKDWYLSVFVKPDTIEYAADKVFDVNGWDLRKFISHIVKSNAVMSEWISSNEVYIRDEVITALLRELAESFFNPISVSYHYLSLAGKKYKEIINAGSAKLKSYFYVLRPLANLAYIEQHRKQPPMNYFNTLAEIKLDTAISDEIARLAEMKESAEESVKIPENKIMTGYFAASIYNYEEKLRAMTYVKNRNYEYADTMFRKIIEMAWNSE